MNRFDNLWNMSVPPEHIRKTEVWLLTTMGITVKGHWTGRQGEHFIGWSADAPYKDYDESQKSSAGVVMVRKPTHDACTVQQ